MTFTFTTPESSAQKKLLSLEGIIARINEMILEKGGAAFSTSCSEIRAEDIEALKPLLNASSWNARRVSVNDADKFSNDVWLFEDTRQHCVATVMLRFVTPTQAREALTARLKATFDQIEALIVEHGGAAFSISCSSTKPSEVEALKPYLLQASWNVRRIEDDKFGNDTWFFQPVGA